MRLLLDRQHLGWERAWRIVQGTCSYTNHTLMPEALETWPVALVARLLPRHLQIIHEINRRFLDEVRRRTPGDAAQLQRLSIVDDSGEPRLRMAHLATIGSHRVNGVSAMHTALMKKTIFADFDRHSPEKLVGITNGISPRRWLSRANPALAGLITEYIGDEWTRDLTALQHLAPLSLYPDFRCQFRAVKQANKERLARVVKDELNLAIDPCSLFDVQIKRLHEYKRQLLNVLHLIIRYNRICEGRDGGAPPRTAIFSGKAAPGYAMAKRVLSLIHAVADVVNRDRRVGDRLKIVFVPDYGVSKAEQIVPACDLSEQISTAGTEASGTGNMKLALNGALTIGTADGANIEIREEVGAENMFLFGLSAEEIAARRRRGYEPRAVCEGDAELSQALDMIAGGCFSRGRQEDFQSIYESVTVLGDHFFVLADCASYLAAQQRADGLYLDAEEWSRRAILNVAGMGRFSSDPYSNMPDHLDASTPRPHRLRPATR